jgi:hypothetical protein
MQENSNETELDKHDDGGDDEPGKLEASQGQYANEMEAHKGLGLFQVTNHNIFYNKVGVKKLMGNKNPRH